MRGLLSEGRLPRGPDIDDLFRPAEAFAHPQAVVRDPDLSINEKRAILASWASDACAIEAVPSLRRLPAGGTVAFDEIADALKELDEQARRGMEHTPLFRRLVRDEDGAKRKSVPVWLAKHARLHRRRSQGRGGSAGNRRSI